MNDNKKKKLTIISLHSLKYFLFLFKKIKFESFLFSLNNKTKKNSFVMGWKGINNWWVKFKSKIVILDYLIKILWDKWIKISLTCDELKSYL